MKNDKMIFFKDKTLCLSLLPHTESLALIYCKSSFIRFPRSPKNSARHVMT